MCAGAASALHSTLRTCQDRLERDSTCLLLIDAATFVAVCSMLLYLYQAPQGQRLFALEGKELIPLTYSNNQIVKADQENGGICIPT